MFRVLVVIAFVTALASCASVASPTGPLVGSWGGQHVGLVLTPDGGTLDYDCAGGRVEGPVIPAPSGQFLAFGWHRSGHGGPAREGEILPTWPARYSGSVRGEWITLRVDVPGRNIVIGPYELRRGVEPILMRCL